MAVRGKSCLRICRKILSSSFNEAIVKERADVRALSDSTMAELKAKGMTIQFGQA